MELNCPYFKKCGGCDFLDVDYNEELLYKKKTVEKELKRNNVFTKVDDIIKMYYPGKYRNNVHLAVGIKDKEVVVGFYKKGSKTIIDVNGCSLFDSWLDKLIKIIKKFVKDFKIKPYDLESNKGIIRYVTARHYKNNIIVTLVVTSQNFGGKEVLYSELKKEFNKVSLWLNINNRTDSAVFSNNFVHKYGEQKLDINICGISAKILPKSFVQTNIEITNKIYKKAVDEIISSKCNKVIDLFSGIGITSNIFAKNGLNVLSVEMEKSSVIDALEIAKENGTQDKIKFLLGKCEDVTDEIKEFSDDSTSVFVDPAKNGINSDVIETIKKINPKKIVYMSCNPETMARDLKLFINDNQYQLQSVTPYDMFARIDHIEVLSVLTKVDKKVNKSTKLNKSVNKISKTDKTGKNNINLSKMSKNNTNKSPRTKEKYDLKSNQNKKLEVRNGKKARR